MLQPIVVRPLAGGSFELSRASAACARRRWSSSRPIPALVRDTDDWERLDLALAENMARVDLNAVEEARACAMLVDDLGLTKEEVGRRVGRSRVAISNLIRLLELPEEALELIESGALSEGHGRAILLCKDHARRGASSRSRPATAAGRSARPSAAPARLGVSLSLSRSASHAWSTPTSPRRWPPPRMRSRPRSAAP